MDRACDLADAVDIVEALPEPGVVFHMPCHLRTGIAAVEEASPLPRDPWLPCTFA